VDAAEQDARDAHVVAGVDQEHGDVAPAHNRPAITSRRVASPSSVVMALRPSIIMPRATSPSSMTRISAARILKRRAM